MTFTTIGDLAQGFALRRENTALKHRMQALSQELASGLASNVTEHLSGDFMRLSDVQHKLRLSETYERGADQGRTETAVMQLALETMQITAEALSQAALTFGSSAGVAGIDSLAGEARAALGTIVSALNSDVGGRSLFSGDEVTQSPLSSSSDFLAALQAAVAGAANATDVTTALDTFFAPGGGFETLIYQGGTGARNPYALGEGETVTLDLKANDPAFRNMLKQVAIAAVLDGPGITLNTGEQFDLAAQAGVALLTSQNEVTNIRADLGFAEGRIERATTRLAAERASLSLVQSELLSVDPYETGTELQQVQLQLETLYTITSRMSRLNLVNYL